MIRLSEIISKQVICLESAEIVGTVSNVFFDFSFEKARFLEVYSEDFADFSKFIPVPKLAYCDSDAVVIKSRTSLLSLAEIKDLGSPSPINSQCFSYDGAYLGTVADILFDKAKVALAQIKKPADTLPQASELLEKKDTLDCEKQPTNLITLIPKNILSFSENILIANNPSAPIKLAKRASAFVAKSNPPVNVHNNNIIAKNNLATQQNILVKTQETAPSAEPFSALIKNEDTMVAKSESRIFTASASAMPTIEKKPPPPLVVPTKLGFSATDKSKYSFLIGKTITEPVFNNEIQLFAQGDTVTSDTLTKAIETNKLLNLALHCQ